MFKEFGTIEECRVFAFYCFWIMDRFFWIDIQEEVEEWVLLDIEKMMLVKKQFRR